MKRIKVKKREVEKETPGENHSRVTLLFCLTIAVITSIVYFSSLRNDWTDWDDGDYVFTNELVKNFDAGGIFSKYVAGNYHPITILFLALEYKTFHDNAT